ncbi:MAG: tetratricopeptide repeat protein [bacterium]|nr:tetratricopeptide repeat protein [bacterium]
MLDRITVDIKNFMMKRFNNESNFDGLCRELEIDAIFAGNFDERISSLIKKLERDIPNPSEELYNALLVLSPNFKQEINSLFGILSPGTGSGSPDSGEDSRQVKILSITASPEDSILYEREQEVLLDSFQNFTHNKLAIDMPDPMRSTLTEIELWLNEYQHDILILSAHGSVSGGLRLEDELGDGAAVSGMELALKLKSLKNKPLIVILSACFSGNADIQVDLASPARTIFENCEVPCVIGMKKEISNFAAIDFNKGFIDSLMEGDSAKAAFEMGRKAIAQGEALRIQDQGDMWVPRNEDSIPVLFCREDELSENLSIKDFNDSIIGHSSRPNSADFLRARYMERGFIGRRMELRGVLRKVLREKDGVVVVKGPGGIGKSAFTTRVCANLMARGYAVIPLVGSISVKDVMERLFDRAREAGISGADVMRENSSGSGDKFLWLLNNYLLRNGDGEKIAIIFDNFEDNQEESSGNTGEELRQFIGDCNKLLSNHAPVLFITTRVEIPFVRTALDLGELSPMENRKLFLNFKTLSRLSGKEIGILRRDIGANPRALALLEVIAFEEFGDKEFDLTNLDELIKEAKKIVIADSNSQEHDFTPWFIGRLVSYLGEDEVKLLKAISIYREPVEKEGLEVFGIIVSRESRKKLERFSLVEYVPRMFYVHRLTAGYVVGELFKKDELKEWRGKAGKYLFDKEDEEGHPSINDHIEAISQFREAGEFDRAFEIADVVQAFLEDRGYIYEARDILEEFLEDELEEKNRAGLFHSIGIIEQKQGNWDKALSYYNDSMKIYENLGDKSSISINLHNIGTIDQQKGNHERAITFFQKSLKINEELGNKSSISGSLHQIGLLHQYKGDYEQAITFYQKSLKINEELGNKSRISDSLLQIGIIYQKKGDYEQAITFFQKSLKINEELGNKSRISNTLHQIGMIHQQKKDYEQAITFYQKSLSIKEELGDKNGISITLHQIGIIYQKKGDYEQAITFYQKSLKISKELGNKYGIANSKGQIGFLKLELEKYTEALDDLTEAYLLCEKLGTPEIEIVRNGILEAKNHINEKDFKEILNQAGIDPEKLPQEEETDFLKMFTILALQDGAKAAEAIRKIVNGISEEAQETEKVKFILTYFQFLLELATAENKKEFVEKADPNMVETMLKYMKEYVEEHTEEPTET